MIHKTPISIVSGFLGAGKTTFIKKLVKDVYTNQKVIVLENEFGKIDLDSENLMRDRIIVESIKGGCICCSSAGMLAVSVQEIIEKYHPDRIIIEPTGLAQLTDVMEALREPFIEENCEFSHIITIVDARNYYRRISISKVFFENQISASRVIFLSKTVNLGAEKLQQVKDDIQAVNPFCEITDGDWDHMSAMDFESVLAFSQHSAAKGTDIEQSAGSEMFQSFSYEGDDLLSEKVVQDLFDDIRKNDYGVVHRAKGIFQTPGREWYSCEFVPGDIRIQRLDQEMPSLNHRIRMCVIGLRLNSGMLRNAIKNGQKA